MKTRIALFLGGLILAGCSKGAEDIPSIPAAPLPERTYKNPTHGFVIPIPDGWEIKDTGNKEPIVVTLISPRKDPGDRFRETFSVQLQPNKSGLTAQQYFDESLAEREMVKDFELLSTAHEMIGKDEALGAIARMDPGGLQVKVLSYTIVHGKNVYTLTAVATPESFDEYKGLFRGLALAFQAE